ncbi:putative membrane protein [Faunimonas pinastri]|uniref:Protoporphyrinogen IX oxidase n=1 Tax=Faunimonas pinastri TaxID=1855383 RepID=A0A1H9GWJ7_9HYPH|nr:protoporphyrinogen oxidase HemJ [Faunimonas pinastri]SEQ54373.1 putative membrane protein [Faunimonas pinastri]
MLTVKALHIISLVAWMAALFYLPRLMVYHADVPPGSPQSETFKVMERRLLKAIANPAMIATWIFGITLATMEHAWPEHWLHAKLLCVVILSAVHMGLARWVRLFGADRNPHSARFYRIVNEIPTLLLVIIVFLVVLKPF